MMSRDSNFLSLSFLKIKLLFKKTNSFLAALGLSCCMRAFPSCTPIAVLGLLIVVASPIVELGL